MGDRDTGEVGTVSLLLAAAWRIVRVPAMLIVEFLTGGIGARELDRDLPRKRLFGWVLRPSECAEFRRRARDADAWPTAVSGWFRVGGTPDEPVLISRTGWTVAPITAEAPYRRAWWTVQVVEIATTGERVVLIQR
jgi:hypothetical protein